MSSTVGASSVLCEFQAALNNNNSISKCKEDTFDKEEESFGEILEAVDEVKLLYPDCPH